VLLRRKHSSEPQAERNRSAGKGTIVRFSPFTCRKAGLAPHFYAFTWIKFLETVELTAAEAGDYLRDSGSKTRFCRICSVLLSRRFCHEKTDAQCGPVKEYFTG